MLEVNEKLDKDQEENALVNAQGYFKDAKRNMISTSVNKKVVVDGLSDFIIVETKDTLMIYPKSKEQDIKEVSKEVELRFGKS